MVFRTYFQPDFQKIYSSKILPEKMFSKNILEYNFQKYIFPRKKVLFGAKSKEQTNQNWSTYLAGCYKNVGIQKN